MAESRVRKAASKKKQAKQKQELREERATQERLGLTGSKDRSWVPWVFVPVGLLGVIWMVLWNLAGSAIPGMSLLGNWNLAIGIGLIIASFSLMTLWK
ncbi:MAG: cell division protein CrgA [Propionibacterium sp.]|nr:cell division protein CrgA [Propionibacterium sp.]